MTAVATGAGREVVLGAPPRLGELYARAGLASGRAAVGGRVRRVLHRGGGAGDAVALPAVTHRLDGVHPDAEQLTAYQHLVGEPAGDVLPAGYVHVLAFPVAIALIVRPDFPMPPLGIVHLANRVEQREALRLGDVLEIRAWAQDLRPHRRGAQVDLVSEVRRAGHPESAPAAWRGISTYLAPGVGARRGETYTWDVEFASPVLLPATPAVSVARDGDGWVVTAWDARKGKLHLRSEVRPLG
ncbi:hypothetical protein [Cellulomonas hominis]|uniref:hypothetical protein n=1 Tax=Cellulomonas hominis TaxID=156981 RepID=UPI001B9B61E7|nr:hypothetical protein [Cellulomonas hominis]VTR77704.1 hypothetical protein CHMI_02476 [Cellulomonas hominis]